MLNQLRRLGDGNFGNAKSVGEGVHELRMDFGPGYRAYFINRDERLILLLCGGEQVEPEAGCRAGQGNGEGRFRWDTRRRCLIQPNI